MGSFQGLGLHMKPVLRLSAAEQVAAYLRGELERGRWLGSMPGVDWLAAELGFNRKTMEAALRVLEKDGWLVGRGAGRKRGIVPRGGASARPMRIALLSYDPVPLTEGYTVELQHLLMEAGHTVFFAEKCLSQLGMNLGRIARLVRKTKADAWVINAGSREVLEWFGTQPVAAFALFGRREGLPIASTGPHKPPAMVAATRRLLELGHRSIVLLARRERRLPQPGTSEQAFLDELTAHGIPAGAFNLPEWEETTDGFHECLQELFRVTPPTALIVDDAPLFTAAQQFVARRHLLVPEQVSLICTDADPAFAWCKPSIAHIRWESGPVIRRIVRWAARVSRGRPDLRQTLTKAEFVAGGTIGPVWKG